MREIIFLIAFLSSCQALAQDNDPLLFSIGDDKVHVSEFKYIYEKNNAGSADYSEKSINEYLDLYKKFKLKVHKAKSLGMDTIKSLQRELEGYRKQLADSYLKDKEIADRLVDEVLGRAQEDREVSHIFFAADEKAGATMKERARKKADETYEKLKANKGAGFGMMAKTLSEDKTSSKNEGYLGYYTAPLPDGFYEFERAMYDTPKGSFSKPIRSKMGYHIIYVSNIRPARGEMEIAHILIKSMVNGATRPDAKRLIDSLDARLKKGEAFEDVAKAYSEDNKTKQLGGYLGFMGVNQYEKIFEDSAFGLTKDGQVSKPVKSKVGYHLIKRISQRTLGNDKKARKRIQSRLSKNDRQSIAENQLLDNVKLETGFKENRKLLEDFTSTLDESFYTYKWSTQDDYKLKGALFNIEKRYYNIKDFAEFTKKSIRTRLKFQKSNDFNEAVDYLYDAFVRQELLAHEEANLEEKYPDFKALMREYREGILLFEITKNEVWDKASQDTVGLKSFFEENRSSYMWPDRLKTKKVTFKSEESDKLYKYAKKKGFKKFMDKYGKDKKYEVLALEVIMEDNVFGGDRNKLKTGEISDLNKVSEPFFYVFESSIPSSRKTMEEARGYVIADYQDKLESGWVKSLMNEFPININSETLKGLVKK